MKIAILGAGSWGAALGKVLYENGSDVLLWHLEIDFVDKINRSHEHPFLPGVKLRQEIRFTASLNEITEYGDLLVSALPSQVVRSVLVEFPSNWQMNSHHFAFQCVSSACECATAAPRTHARVYMFACVQCMWYSPPPSPIVSKGLDNL